MITPLALLTTFAYLATLVLFVVLHVQNSHYSMVEHAVSDYGVGKSKRLFTIYNVLGSVAALLLAALFWQSSVPTFALHTPLLLVLMVLARTGIALFPTDLEGQNLTRIGRLHYLFAILNFGLAYTVIAQATPLLAPGSGGLSGVLHALQVLAMISLAGVVISMIGPLRRFFGLIERAFLLSVMLWFLMAALSYLLR